MSVETRILNFQHFISERLRELSNQSDGEELSPGN
jgi:hypothetical protein